MEIVVQILISIGLGVGVSALLLALPLAKNWQTLRQGESPYPAWLIVLAVAMGYLVGYSYSLAVWFPEFPPQDSTQWGYFFVLLTLAFGLFQAFEKLPVIWGAILRFCLLFGYAYLLLRPLMGGDSAWSGLKSSLILGGVVLGGFGLWHVLENFAETYSGPWMPGLLSLLMGSSSVFFLWGHSALLFQLGLVLTGILSVLFGFGLLFPQFNLEKGGVSVIWVALWGLSLSAWFYAELSWWFLGGLSAFCPLLLQWRFQWQGLKTRMGVLAVVFGIQGSSLVAAYWEKAQAENLNSEFSDGSEYY